MSAINILLVEDNEGDIILTTEALNEAYTNNRIAIIRDGEKAIQYLNKDNDYAKAPRPDLILLDINLPRVDGKEVLHFIKTNPDLKTIPVVMLTTSTSQNDILESYSNHANCYISKPVDIDDYFKVVEKIENFWSTVAQLPKYN